MRPDAKAVRAELLEIFNTIEPLSDEEILHGDRNRSAPVFERLDRLAASEVAPEVVQQLIADPELEPALKAISRLRNTYGLRLEIEQARELLDAPVPWKRVQRFHFFPNYLRLAVMEQQAAGLQPGDRILFIGSGPLPLSLILLCHQFDLRGIGLEQDSDLALLGQRVVNRLGLGGRIEIRPATHHALPLPEKAALVMVAAMARPKDEIFAHLAQTMPPGTLVSYRLYEKGLRRLLDLDGGDRGFAGFTLHRKIQPVPPVNNTVMMVRRTG
ncbi:nicotianamine synthase family protein [Desulfolithobacter sp.]